MRKMVLLAAMMAMAVMMLAAAPAMADDWDWNDDHHDNDRWWDDRWWDNRFDNGFFFGGDGIDQSFDQEAESGDVDQSFDVSSTGDNSNQTAGIQGVANTGNAQNQVGVIDAADFADDFFDGANRFFFDEGDGDFEFDGVGSSKEVSPTNTTSGDQQVNQAASAFGS
jgi:hypothetical protein